MAHLRCLLALLLSLLALHALAKKDKPEIEETKFKDPPVNIVYFEDSDTILIRDRKSHTAYRSDDGGAKWKPLKGQGEILDIVRHPYDKHTAVVLGGKRHHWITHDRGESWSEFDFDADPSRARAPIEFHADDPNRMLFLAESCAGLLCDESVYYTTDGFKTKPKPLTDQVTSCIWAKGTDIFTTGDDKRDKNRILCMARGKFSFFMSKNRILMSDDFFESDPVEPTMSDGRTVEGVHSIAAVKKYMVFAAKSEKTTEMAMYVSDDTETWHRAEFGEHKLEEDAYTLLESTNYSMQVDVMNKPMSPMGVLLTSNSNGTFFTRNVEHTNRNMRGFVDFEKVSNIQGIVLVNTVKNWEDVERKFMTDKEVVSQISFDDGRTWEDMKVDDKTLHLHSVTKQRNLGRIFSSPAPGIVMGVGNTGKYLKKYDEGDLFVSDDAGRTWKLALEKPHIYEFGAQGSILVAVRDGETKAIQWSLDHGKNWDKLELEDRIRPLALTTTPDSTSLKFMLIATKGQGSQTENLVYALDFAGLHETECGKDDFEKWSARVDDKGEPTCIMGHIQYFRRRKAKANCLVISKDFEDPEEDRETCKCTKQDFECDYNFKRDGDGKCVQNGALKAPDGACEDGKKTFKGSSGYRLIPGNDCKGGEDLAEEVEHECSDTKAPPVSGEIANEVTKFSGDKFLEYYYLERTESATGDDETIVMRTDRGEVFKTRDHGKKWEQILKEKEILAIYPHQYNNDRVYMITPTKEVWYSNDRLEHIHSFNATDPPNREGIQVLNFHPKEQDWLIWTGGRDCKSGGRGCLTVAEKTTNSGEDWTTLLKSVRKCQFVYREDRESSEKLVYCEQFEREEDRESPLQLMSSNDWFETKNELKRDVINWATMAEYIVVAIKDEKQQTLKVDTSIDGKSFADAHFPPNFNVPHQQAYTVLDSSTHAIFLHVTVNGERGKEYGSIVKSNSNGTSYVLSVADVNRNEDGYVDFEKMQGIEGVALINRVANTKETEAGSAKKLKTYITHNDGAGWTLLGRPVSGPDGKGYDCGNDVEKCSLHLHGYTERKHASATFSSPSAVGLMMGTGNVGEYLGYKKEADTFITTDGGIQWKFAAEGNWMWEYGDRGSIIVIVKENQPTDFVRYTLDEGKTWKEHKIGVEMRVRDITTVPSDTSRNFLLWGIIDDKIATINIDFSGMKERSKQCKLDDNKPEDDDYILWSPKHPLLDDDCLFGHVAQYHRKRVDRACYNGRLPEDLHAIARNCSCVREDFECDYNYEPGASGECSLVPGLEKPNPEAVCEKNKDLTEYYEITGYRRIPLTTCQGGKELDYTSRTHACPGKEEEYKKKHAISGAGLFFAIVLPIAAAAGIGYWVWKNWDGKFGRIRLGDGLGGGYGGAFDGEAPWIKYPVMVVSGVVAVLAAIPMVIGSLWRMISTRTGRGGGGYSRPYTSRSSFQRTRGDYAVVDPELDDEGELLGVDSDEDV